MKKLFSILIIMLVAITASAQAPFTVYRPITPSSSRNYSPPSYNYGYDNSNSFYYQAPQNSQQEESQVLSTRGYYIQNNQWNSVLLRVKIIGDNIYVVGIKRRTTGWSNESIKAYSTELMQQEIKDNFDYYIGDYVYGKIYF